MTGNPIMHGMPEQRRTLLVGAGALALALGAAACTPTVKVEIPDKPININLNVNVRQEVIIKLEKDVEELIGDNPDLFGTAPAAPKPPR